MLLAAIFACYTSTIRVQVVTAHNIYVLYHKNTLNTCALSGHCTIIEQSKTYHANGHITTKHIRN